MSSTIKFMSRYENGHLIRNQMIPITSGEQYVPAFLAVTQRIKAIPAFNEGDAQLFNLKLPNGRYHKVLQSQSNRAAWQDKVRNTVKYFTRIPTSYSLMAPAQVLGLSPRAFESAFLGTSSISVEHGMLQGGRYIGSLGFFAKVQPLTFNYGSSAHQAFTERYEALQFSKTTVDPQILLLVKAKYLPYLGARAAMGEDAPPLTLPYNALRLLRSGIGLATFIAPHLAVMQKQFELQQEFVSKEVVNSFLFSEPTPQPLQEAIQNALTAVGEPALST